MLLLLLLLLLLLSADYQQENTLTLDNEIAAEVTVTLLLRFSLAFFNAFARDPTSPSLLNDLPMPGGGGGGGGGPALILFCGGGGALFIMGIEGGEAITVGGAADCGIDNMGAGGGGGGGGAIPMPAFGCGGANGTEL